MKATGIVRNIDPLGRLVIPKELRDINDIKEGDPLEIFTENDGSIILKKFNSSRCISCGNQDATILKKLRNGKCICAKCLAEAE